MTNWSLDLCLSLIFINIYHLLYLCLTFVHKTGSAMSSIKLFTSNIISNPNWMQSRNVSSLHC